MLTSLTLAGLPKRTSGFDFLVGEWTVQNRRLREPLSGREDWYTTPATARATVLHNGAVSVDEMWFLSPGSLAARSGCTTQRRACGRSIG